MRARTGLALTMASIATAALVTTRAQEPSNGVLLVGVGVHVEPVGLSSGRILTGKNSYADEQLFRRHAGYLRSLASIVERHGGRLTVQVGTRVAEVDRLYTGATSSSRVPRPSRIAVRASATRRKNSG